MHLFSENKKRNDFGNSFFFGGEREGELRIQLRNVETTSAILYCRFGFYYNYSTSSTFKE